MKRQIYSNRSYILKRYRDSWRTIKGYRSKIKQTKINPDRIFKHMRVDSEVGSNMNTFFFLIFILFIYFGEYNDTVAQE